MVKEGFYWALPFLLVSIVFFIGDWVLPSAIFALVSLAMALFHRDPKRVAPAQQGILLSPADGKVMGVEKIGEMMRISIFMSPLDVHVNRSPCKGKIEKIIHKGGGHLPAYKPESAENERVEMDIVCEEHRIKVVLIAGIIARRIKPYVKEGQIISGGERIGVITFGSRVDVYFPFDFLPQVQEGEKVKAGVSIIARRKNEKESFKAEDKA